MSRSVGDKKNIFNATTRSQVVLILELNMEILDVSFFVVCCRFAFVNTQLQTLFRNSLQTN